MSKLHPIELPSHEFLAALVRTDPQGYEALRRGLIAELIDNAPERMKPRLRGMQFRIDCERRLSKSALGMTVRLYRLMWDSFLKLNDNMQRLNAPAETVPAGAKPPAPSPPRPEAQVLEFRARRSGDNGPPRRLP